MRWLQREFNLRHSYPHWAVPVLRVRGESLLVDTKWRRPGDDLDVIVGVFIT